MLKFRSTLLAVLALAVTARAQVFSATQGFIPTPDQPAAVYAADVNGDGYTDILSVDGSATPTSSATRVFLSDGKGGFTNSALIPTAGSFISVADFDGDGKLDVAWVTWTAIAGAKAWLAKGDGAGHFATPVASTFALSPNQAPANAVFVATISARLHDAGPPSLVFGDTSQSMLYVLTYAGGAFQRDTAIYVADNISNLQASDANGDGHADILVIGSTSAYLDSFFGRGDGTLQTGFRQTGAGYIASQLFADMTGDGLVDHLTEDNSGTIDIYAGSTSGMFVFASLSGTGLNDASSGHGGYLVQVADFNSDCHPDILANNNAGLSVLLGQSTKPPLNFTLERSYKIVSSHYSFATGDFNHDGHFDLAFDSGKGIGILWGAPQTTACVQNVVVTGALTASSEPSLYGADFVLTAAFTPASSGLPSPTGTVTFAIDGVTAGTGTLSGGSASFNVLAPTLLPGTHSITATYPGDSNYSSISLAASHTVTKLRSQTTFAVAAPTIYYGQAAGTPANVLPIDTAPNASVNGGAITFYDGGTVVCVTTFGGLPVTCPGIAGAGLSAGSHALTAAYSGNTYYASSVSGAGTVVVLPDVTQASVTSSLNPSYAGQSVTLTAQITAPYAVADGAVDFYDGTTLIGTGSLDSSGVAAISTPTLTIGVHSITVNYAGAKNFSGSVSSVLQQVVFQPAVASTTLLSSSTNPSVIGQQVTFTAAVSLSAAVVGTLAGANVSFFDGTTVIATVPLSAAGIASLSVSNLSLGNHIITAAFVGSLIGLPSVSAPLTQTVVNALPAGFSLTVTPGALSVPIGNSVSVLVTVADTGTFHQPVTLACSGVVSEASCAFGSTTIPAGGGVTRLTLTAAAPHDCENNTPYFVTSGPSVGFGVLTTSLLALSVRRRKRLLRGIVLALLVGALPAVTGCGHCTDLGVRPGTYSFTLTGTSTGTPTITVSQTLQMVAHL